MNLGLLWVSLSCSSRLQACDLPYFDKRPLSRPFGLYRLEPTSPTQVASRQRAGAGRPFQAVFGKRVPVRLVTLCPSPCARRTAQCTASTRTPSRSLWKWPPSTTPSWRCPEPGGSPTTSRPNPWRTNEQRQGWREERERENRRRRNSGQLFLVNLTLSHSLSV